MGGGQECCLKANGYEYVEMFTTLFIQKLFISKLEFKLKKY